MKVQIIVKKSDAEKFLQYMVNDTKVLMLKGKTEGDKKVIFEVTYK